MRTIQIIDKDELKEKLGCVNLLSDELCDFMAELRKMYKKYGLSPQNQSDKAIDDYYDRTKWGELIDKYGIRITKKIEEYLLEKDI